DLYACRVEGDRVRLGKQRFVVLFCNGSGARSCLVRLLKNNCRNGLGHKRNSNNICCRETLIAIEVLSSIVIKTLSFQGNLNVLVNLLSRMQGNRRYWGLAVCCTDNPVVCVLAVVGNDLGHNDPFIVPISPGFEMVEYLE